MSCMIIHTDQKKRINIKFLIFWRISEIINIVLDRAREIILSDFNYDDYILHRINAK